MHMFEHIKQLNDVSLFSDVKKLACIALTLNESQPDLLTPAAKYQTLVYYGDAIFKEKEYKRAEVVYKKALQVKKWMNKSKGKPQKNFGGVSILLHNKQEKADGSVCESDSGAMDTTAALSPKQSTTAAATTTATTTSTPPPSPASHTSPGLPHSATGSATKKNIRTPLKKTPKEKKPVERTRKMKKEDENIEPDDSGDLDTRDECKSPENQRCSQNSSLTEDPTENQDICSEAELRYKLHHCYVSTRQPREAITVLEGINAKLRNAKINMALAKLYHNVGMDRSAVTAYKAVLRECPMSMDASQGLLALGVKGTEVCSLMMMGGYGQGGGVDWLSPWIRAQAASATKDYTNSANTFRSLDVKPVLRDNLEVLCKMGQVQYLSGNYVHALETLQRVHSIDSLLLSKKDLLSFLLYKENAVKELETLSCHLMQVSETAPEPWVSMGYYCMATKKPTKAVYFAQKAYTLDTWNVEALLLKGTALLELKKTQDAVPHFREVLRIAPHRFEAHKGLVDCYVCSHRTREAITYAGQAVKQLGQSARSLTLYASVLAQEPLNLEKAKTYLERAMKMECVYLEPVYIMAEILWQQQQYDKGIELLRKSLQQQSTPKLHQMLGDFLSHNNEQQEALDQYSIALSLEPNNQKAREGLERIEKQGDMGMDTTYDVEVDDINDSDNEADLDGSDIESAWSDIELN